MMTHRQWVILQCGLLALQCFVDSDTSGGWTKATIPWDTGEDGPVPTIAEINEVAEIVGRMARGPKEGECPA